MVYALDGGLVPRAEPGRPRVARGATPVVSGNNAAEPSCSSASSATCSHRALYVDNGNVLDAATGRLLAEIADLACDRWQSRDAGMWELPEAAALHDVQARLLEALTNAVAPRRARAGPRRRRPLAHRGRPHPGVGGDALLVRGARRLHLVPGSDELDASMLLHAISGFDRGGRMTATLDALRRELGAGPHLYRYSGAAKRGGRFLACSYWMVSALHLVRAGRTRPAS